MAKRNAGLIRAGMVVTAVVLIAFSVYYHFFFGFFKGQVVP